jgi:hypothetical protein
MYVMSLLCLYKCSKNFKDLRKIMLMPMLSVVTSCCMHYHDSSSFVLKSIKVVGGWDITPDSNGGNNNV